MVLFQPFVNSFTELFAHLCNQSISCSRFTASDPWGGNAGILDGNSILMGGVAMAGGGWRGGVMFLPLPVFVVRET